MARSLLSPPVALVTIVPCHSHRTKCQPDGEVAKGGVSDKCIKDDRLVKGAELKLVVADHNKTLREVHLPERKDKDK